MDAEQAIAIIEAVLAPKSLSSVQIEIVRGVIGGKSYQEIVTAAKIDPTQDRQTDRSQGSPPTISAKAGKAGKADTARTGGYQLSYIRETGAQLWQLLSQKLGKKVTKKSLAAILLWYAKQPEFRLATVVNPIPHPVGRIAVDWGEGIQRPGSDLHIDEVSGQRFYGRMAELATLSDWVLNERCRSIFLIGMGGMGKTTLAWEIAHQLEPHFDLTIWRSLLNAPTLSELCADLLRFLSPQPQLLPDPIEAQIELTIACFNRSRCLLILDNVESILEGQVQAGQYLPGYEDYDRLLKAIGELPHQSCAIFTSREKPHTLTRSEIVNPRLVKSMTVDGLAVCDAYQLVRAYGCPQLPEQMWQEVHAHYGGNPLALKIAAVTAVEMTCGGAKMLELYPLMKEGKLQFRNIDDSLHRQFERLSEIEKQLVYWLAIEREPVTGSELRSNLVLNTTMPGEILNALQSLSRRCITAVEAQTWSIQPVMITYVTQRSIDLFVAELAPLTADPPDLDLQSRFVHLNNYAIIKAQAKDYLRKTQTQSILRQVIDRLLSLWGNPTDLSQHLRQILSQWQALDPIPPGYLAGNILNLSIELEPDRSLKDLDCSQLPIRSAYLADTNLYQVNFAAATFDRSVFTQAFGGIVFAICHPAGELVATGDANGDVSLWQLADGQRVALYQGHTNWTRSLAFSTDGRILATSSEDCTVRFWEIATGIQIALLGPHTHTLRGLKFSRDGRKFLTGGDDCQIRIYDLPRLLADGTVPTVDSHCLQSLTGHTNWVFTVVYNHDESRLASASADGTVKIWDVATGRCLQTLPHEHWVIRVLFTPDGRSAIVSGMSATIYIWDTSSGQLIQTLTGHSDWVWSIEMSADGQTLYSTGEDRTIRKWDLRTGLCLDVFRAHKDRIWTISLTPDERHLVSGSEDRTIGIWDLHRGKCVKTINGYGNWIKSIAFVPPRGWLASGHHDRSVRLWNWQNQTCVHTLSGHTDAVVNIAVSPDGNYLASSSLDRTIRIWDLQNLTCRHTIDNQVEGVCALGFSPDSTQLIAGDYHADLKIWNLDTGRLDRVLPGHPSRIQSVAVCNVQHLIATACDNQIRIWDLATGQCLHTIIAHYLPVLSIAFSPDGSYLASGSMDKTAKVWNTQSWDCVQTLIGHQSWTIAVAFSPQPVTSKDRTDYQIIVSGGDRLIKRWDIHTGECLQTYTGHTNWVWSIAYCCDGQSIASAGEDETIKIWDVDRPQAVRTLRLQRPYEEMNITGATGLPSGQRQILKLLGAIDD